ncbi:unnamed protein product [Amoebophrya sp. A120]|nr:unnamed protein product [Amoebophrya sp. A120]|eukprot:GSA120T00003498001.1
MSSALAVPLSAATEDWDFLEYFLQVSCRSSQVKVKNVWSLTLPEVEAGFSQRTATKLVLPCWLPVSQLDPQQNAVQDVCRRGFRFHERNSGMLVQCGNFSIPGLGDPADINFAANGAAEGNHLLQAGGSSSSAKALGKRVFEAFLCHAGVGRSQLVTSEELVLDAEKLLQNCDRDFDSVYIHRKNRRTKLDSVDPLRAASADQHTFQHEYLLKDQSQLLPKYLVHFELDPSEPEKFALSLCDSCQKEPAAVWCEADQAKLCEECDLELHSLNKIVARHVRVPIFEMPRAVGDCPLHPGMQITQYCATCHEFLCPACLTAGNHASGAILATHKLLPIQEAYRGEIRTAAEAGGQFNTAVNQRREEIKHTLVELESLIAKVQRGGQQAEDRVYAIVQESLQKFQTHTEHHVQQLLSDNLNTKRQLEFFDWIESFIQRQMMELSPPNFLRAWTRHRKLQQKLADMWHGEEGTGASTAGGASSSSQGGAAPGVLPPGPDLAAIRLVGGLKVATASSGP